MAVFEFCLQRNDDKRRISMIIEFRDIDEHTTIAVVQGKISSETPILKILGPNDEPFLVLLDKDGRYAVEIGVNDGHLPTSIH